ncbi:hypothetical protein [Legionella sp. km772]|uniref:hypothetical protein n=1 Tax=Legionella sp. km772 TaxID=2498111 RepID=UPI000F8E0849|nr:hypothetical protein [Legionella sp. km772]RUR06189.1 hypothetical protein ELY15_13430 [Legionella sp. km772]
MSLQLSPAFFKELNSLITQFNLVPEHDAIQRIFFLQKINAELNRTELNDDLFNWLYDTSNEAWHSNLKLYGINPDASIFLKNIQFAQAVTKHNRNEGKKIADKNEYDLLQQRDALLKQESFEEIREEYTRLCAALINSCYAHKLVV